MFAYLVMNIQTYFIFDTKVSGALKRVLFVVQQSEVYNEYLSSCLMCLQCAVMLYSPVNMFKSQFNQLGISLFFYLLGHKREQSEVKDQNNEKVKTGGKFVKDTRGALCERTRDEAFSGMKYTSLRGTTGNAFII